MTVAMEWAMELGSWRKRIKLNIVCPLSFHGGGRDRKGRAAFEDRTAAARIPIDIFCQRSMTERHLDMGNLLAVEPCMFRLWCYDALERSSASGRLIAPTHSDACLCNDHDNTGKYSMTPNSYSCLPYPPPGMAGYKTPLMRDTCMS